MISNINFNGLEFEITDTGYMEQKGNTSGASCGAGGMVGVQVHQHPLSLDPSRADGVVRTVASLFIDPAQARLLAQALLAAATSVQSRL